MSFELGEAIRRCGLETGARRAILDALACYTDDQTGLARVSRVMVAMHAGVSERTVQRLLQELCADDELQGLVRLVREAHGRGNAAVYRVDIARLEPLSDALKAAGRKVFAGVGKALADKGLIGRKATPDTIRKVFRALDRLLAEEDQAATRRLVQSHCEAFEAALMSACDLTVIGVPLDRAEGERGGNRPVDKPVDRSEIKGDSLSPFCGGKGDISSRKGDISSRGHSIDTSPSGNTPFARAAGAGQAGEAREAVPVGRIMAASAVGAGNCLFDVEGLLAHATVNRQQRLALTRDLQGRIVRVSRDGVFAIRAVSAADASAISSWIEPLRRWAEAIGLSGVVIDTAADGPASDGEG